MAKIMDHARKRKIEFILITILSIGLPLLLAMKYPAIGGFLLLNGIWFTSRAYRILRADARRDYNNPSLEKIKANSAGQTILVQIVDDFGRELLPQEVEKRLSEAHAKAGPRDTIIPVRFKINQSQNTKVK